MKNQKKSKKTMDFLKKKRLGMQTFQIKSKPKPTFFNNNEPPAKKMRMNDESVQPIFNNNNSSKPKVNIQEQRRKLPMFEVKDQLLDAIKRHNTLIIVGQTGSGKTTQIPHYIDGARLQNGGKIAVTQPRKVAAVSIANRVAEEYGNAEKVGGVVGYTVRFEDRTSNRTRIKYLTDGMLLREAMFDKLLMEYTFVILDEAHERTIHTDVLFGIVKNAQKVREARNLKPLKIIIMSATMDVDKFRKYFNNCEAVYVDGRAYPVELFYTCVMHDDYPVACCQAFFKIHREAPVNHDVLMFLTGQEEIEAVAHQIRMACRMPEMDGPPVRIFTLYASQSNQQQRMAFLPVQENTRKLVIATNVAETSVTISGIKYVIDCGMVKTRSFHPATGLETLKVERISREQANQRTGRAGRESNGYCYRIYTRNQFEMLQQSTVPEIQRSNVTQVALQLLALKIHMLYFDFIDKPPKDTIEAAFKQLKLLGAVESTTSNTLTAVGKQMVKFPIDPNYSKLLISAQDFGCLEEALSIVAMLSSENIMVTPSTRRSEANAARERFQNRESDHIILLNIYRAYLTVDEKDRKKWCRKHFINYRNMDHATKIRGQLETVCRKSGFVFASCGSNLDQFLKCLLAGLFVNCAQFLGDVREKHYVTLNTKQITYIHPSSVVHQLRDQPPLYIFFTNVLQTNKCYMRLISVVKPEWLPEVAPEYVKTRGIKFHRVA